MDISTTAILLTVCVLAFTGVAAVVDWRTHKLPNWLTVPCFVSALVFHFMAGLLAESTTLSPIANAFAQLGWALAGFATGFSILCVLWLIGGGGGGDVKLMGALGAWLMPQATLYVFVVTYVIVLLFMLGVLAWAAATGNLKKMKRSSTKKSKTSVKASKSVAPWKRVLPYGVSVALATWMVLGFLIIRNTPLPDGGPAPEQPAATNTSS